MTSAFRMPWTPQQLDEFLPRLEARMEATEAAAEQEVRPLSPMTVDEALDYLVRLIELASGRPLSERESILHGQLLACYEMAIRAEMLGKKGRYYVLSEDKIKAMMEGL